MALAQTRELKDRLIAAHGLDAHADAWQKTAAYKLLNDTKLGALLEDLGLLVVRAGALMATDRVAPS